MQVKQKPVNKQEKNEKNNSDSIIRLYSLGNLDASFIEGYISSLSFIRRKKKKKEQGQDEAKFWILPEKRERTSE